MYQSANLMPDTLSLSYRHHTTRCVMCFTDTELRAENYQMSALMMRNQTSFQSITEIDIEKVDQEKKGRSGHCIVDPGRPTSTPVSA